MSETPKPIRARPVSPIDPTKPNAATATVATVVIELREIRHQIRRAAAARKRAGKLYLIWGGIFIAAGMLQGPVTTLGASLTGEVGVILMIVGGGMRYD